MTAWPKRLAGTSPLKMLLCSRAAMVIEFAIVFPVLLAFIFGILGFGYVIFESAVLQGALNEASREGKTGFPNTGDPGSECTGGACRIVNGNITNMGTRWQEVQGIMQNYTGAIFDPAKLTFTATSYPSFVDLDNGAGAMASDVGTGSSVVVYTASYPCPILLMSLIGIRNPGNITAYNIVRNEGF